MKVLIILSLFIYITSFMSCTRTGDSQESYRQNHSDQVVDKPGKGIQDEK